MYWRVLFLYWPIYWHVLCSIPDMQIVGSDLLARTCTRVVLDTDTADTDGMSGGGGSDPVMSPRDESCFLSCCFGCFKYLRSRSR